MPPYGKKKKTEVNVELLSKSVIGNRRVMVENTKEEVVPVISLLEPLEGMVRIFPSKSEAVDNVQISFVGYLDLLKDAANSKELLRKTITVTSLNRLEEGQKHELPFSFSNIQVPYESFFGQVAQVRYYIQVQVVRKKPRYECIKNLYVVKKTETSKKPAHKAGEAPQSPSKLQKERPISEEVSSQDKSLHINIRVSSNVIHLETPTKMERVEESTESSEDPVDKPHKDEINSGDGEEGDKKVLKDEKVDEGGSEVEDKDKDKKEKGEGSVEDGAMADASSFHSSLLKGNVTFFVVRNRTKNMTVSVLREEETVCLSGKNFPHTIIKSEIMEGTPKTELSTAACGANSLLTPKNISIPFFINTAALDLTPSFSIGNLLTVRYSLTIDIAYEKNINSWKFPITVVRD